MKKLSIRGRLLLTYGIVLAVIMTLLVLAFSLILTSYMNSRVSGQISNFYSLAEEYAKQYDTSSEEYGDRLFDEIERRIYASTDFEAIMIERGKGTVIRNINFDYKERLEQTTALAKEVASEDFELGKAKYFSTSYGRYVAVKFSLGESDAYKDSRIIVYADLNLYSAVIKGSEDVLRSASIVAAIIMFVAVFVVSSMLSSQIKRLCGFADKLGHNDFSTISEDFSVRELQELAEDMNNAATKLDEYDREQKKFFQNVSHELRTPLMSIQGYAEGIQYGIFPDNKEAAGVIVDESKRLTEMLEQMLYISKMDKSEIKKELCNLSDILRSAKEKLEGLTVDGRKQMSLKLPERDVFVNGDPEALLRAFMNVISNGLRYAERCVDVELCECESTVRVSVSDDGAGIDEEDIGHIFDRFYKGKKGKHGIGLSIAKGISDAHNATLTAENKEDGGARFTFEFHL